MNRHLISVCFVCLFFFCINAETAAQSHSVGFYLEKYALPANKEYSIIVLNVSDCAAHRQGLSKIEKTLSQKQDTIIYVLNGVRNKEKELLFQSELHLSTEGKRIICDDDFYLALNSGIGSAVASIKDGKAESLVIIDLFFQKDNTETAPTDSVRIDESSFILDASGLSRASIAGDSLLFFLDDRYNRFLQFNAKTGKLIRAFEIPDKEKLATEMYKRLYENKEEDLKKALNIRSQVLIDGRYEGSRREFIFRNYFIRDTVIYLEIGFSYVKWGSDTSWWVPETHIIAELNLKFKLLSFYYLPNGLPGLEGFHTSSFYTYTESLYVLDKDTCLIYINNLLLEGQELPAGNYPVIAKYHLKRRTDSFLGEVNFVEALKFQLPAYYVNHKISYNWFGLKGFFSFNDSMYVFTNMTPYIYNLYSGRIAHTIVGSSFSEDQKPLTTKFFFIANAGVSDNKCWVLVSIDKKRMIIELNKKFQEVRRINIKYGKLKSSFFYKDRLYGFSERGDDLYLFTYHFR